MKQILKITRVRIALVLALALAVTAAFAFKGHTEPAKKNVMYYWFASNAAGTSITQPARSNSATTADPSGCTTGLDYCSLGYTQDQVTTNGQGNIVLKSTTPVSGYGAFSQKN